MSDPSVVGAARSQATGRAAVPLARRGEGAPPSRFHRGAHPRSVPTLTLAVVNDTIDVLLSGILALRGTTVQIPSR